MHDLSYGELTTGTLAPDCGISFTSSFGISVDALVCARFFTNEAATVFYHSLVRTLSWADPCTSRPESPTSYAEIVLLATSRCQGERGSMALLKHQEGLGIRENSSESRREYPWACYVERSLAWRRETPLT